MSHVVLSLPEPGQLVDVRQRRYVADIAQSHLPPVALRGNGNAPAHLVTLTSVEDDALDKELQVIWEIEPGANATTNTASPSCKRGRRG